MHVGVDQRSECAGRLHPVIEAEPQLAEEGEIRPEAGRRDDLVASISRDPSETTSRPFRSETFRL